jgi:hypothetical protein
MSDHSAIDPPDLSHGNGLIETKANGKPAPEDTTALLDSVAVAPVLDLMSEALSTPEEFGGSGIASPTAFAVRKPDKDEWFRVHPSFRPDFFLYERKVGNRTVVYLVRKPFVPLFGKAAKPCTLRLCVNVQGTPFFWPCKHALDGFGQSWAESRAAVAQEAARQWIAIEGGDVVYTVILPDRPDIFPEPKWPQGTPNDWLTKGFAGLVVDRADHEAVRLRRGAAL